VSVEEARTSDRYSRRRVPDLDVGSISGPARATFSPTEGTRASVVLLPRRLGN